MRQVRRLQITARHAVTEVFAGEYSSAFKGRGMEFADVREYEPGDDVRFIDWNVTARTGRPFIKRFTEERELTIMLAVDMSASGSFTSEHAPKRQIAAEVCAIIAFAALRKNDRVGLIVFTDEVELYIPPAKGSRHVLRIARELLAYQPRRRETNLKVAADRLVNSLKRRSVVFIVSDFLQTTKGSTTGADALRVLAGKHDTTAVIVEDPRERAWPKAGLIELEDAETGERRLVDAGSPRVRRAFEIAAQTRRRTLIDSLSKRGIDCLPVSTHLGSDKRPSYIHELMMFFRRREVRRSA